MPWTFHAKPTVRNYLNIQIHSLSCISLIGIIQFRMCWPYGISFSIQGHIYGYICIVMSIYQVWLLVSCNRNIIRSDRWFAICPVSAADFMNYSQYYRSFEKMYEWYSICVNVHFDEVEGKNTVCSQKLDLRSISISISLKSTTRVCIQRAKVISYMSDCADSDYYHITMFGHTLDHMTFPL